MEKKKYIPGKSVEDAKQALDAHNGRKPGSYESQWQEAADRILGEIQGRDPFSYDAAADPLYRQAVDQYVRLGRQAMMDTMGQAAALTGGYGNSYAQTVGQQTYGGYLQALAAKLPGFQKMALDRYQARGKDLMDRYQTLSQREKQAYSNYQTILQQYYQQQDRLQNRYDREQDRDYGQYVNERDHAYRTEQDEKKAAARAEQARKEQERWEQQREYQAERDKIQDEQWQKEFEENKRRYEQEWAERHRAPSGGGGGGGGGGRGPGSTHFGKYNDRNSMTGKEYEKDREEAKQNGHYGHLPSGAAWNPHSNPYRPTYQVTLR